MTRVGKVAVAAAMIGGHAMTGLPRANAVSAWELGWYEPRDEASILALSHDECPDTPLCDKAYFDWLVDRGATEGPILPVARERGTGAVVGFAMFLPTRVCRGGQEVPALLGATTRVNSAYRQQGLHTRLVDTALEEGRRRHYPFLLAFPDTASLPSLVRSQHHVVSRAPLLVRPLDVAAVTEGRIGNRALRRCVNAAWALAAGTICRPQGPGRIGSHLRVVEDAAFDEGYSYFWPRVRRKYGVMLMRDGAALQRRFRDVPLHQYRVLSARNGSEVLGYMAMRDAEIDGTPIGLIADLLVLPGEAGTRAGLCLVGEALRIWRDTGVPLSGGLVLPHTHEYAILRRGGYLPAPRALAPRQLHLAVKGLTDGFLPDALAQARTWYVTAADHGAI